MSVSREARTFFIRTSALCLLSSGVFIAGVCMRRAAGSGRNIYLVTGSPPPAPTPSSTEQEAFAEVRMTREEPLGVLGARGIGIGGRGGAIPDVVFAWPALRVEVKMCPS